MRPTSTRHISVVVLLVVAMSLATAAQVGKVPRIGVLLPGSPEPEYERRLDAFRQGLRELGYIDTQNILLEYRWAHAQYEHLADLVAELLSLKVDVLVIDSTRAGLAAKRRPVPSRLCWPLLQTRWAPGSSRASRGRGGTSRG